MTLSNSIAIWHIYHPDEEYLAQADINSTVERDVLLRYLVTNYGSMRTISDDVEWFHTNVIDFFELYKWNFDKLAASLHFDYKPLDNYRYTETLDRGDKETIGYSESGDSNRQYNNQDANLVSAFNDLPSNPPNYIDSERDRKITNGDDSSDYSRQSNSDRGFNRDDLVTKTGHTDEASFQSLIEEERKQAKFNLYKFIIDLFVKELLIAIW